MERYRKAWSWLEWPSICQCTSPTKPIVGSIDWMKLCFSLKYSHPHCPLFFFLPSQTYLSFLAFLLFLFLLALFLLFLFANLPPCSSFSFISCYFFFFSPCSSSFFISCYFYKKIPCSSSSFVSYYFFFPSSLLLFLFCFLFFFLLFLFAHLPLCSSFYFVSCYFFFSFSLLLFLFCFLLFFLSFSLFIFLLAPLPLLFLTFCSLFHEECSPGSLQPSQKNKIIFYYIIYL